MSLHHWKRTILHDEQFRGEKNMAARRNFNHVLSGGARQPKGRGGGGKKNIVFAIPSYNRADLIVHKTLAFLRKNKIPKSHVYIFVHDQVSDYRKTCGAGYHIINSRIKPGPGGLVGQRNVIRTYFPTGTRVFTMDDDIKDIVFHPKRKRGMTFRKFLSYGFAKCKRLGLLHFGIVGHDNTFYFKNNDTTTLKYCPGGCCGFIADPMWKNTYWKQKHDQFEDYELVLKLFKKFGRVLRLNWVGIKTNYYNPNGGMGSVGKRHGAAKTRGRFLMKAYPGWVTLYDKKVKGVSIPNIRLNHHAHGVLPGVAAK